MEKSMQSLIETLYGVKSGYGHYKVSIDVDGQELSTVTDNMSAIDAAFDEYYDDEDNEGRFYESREEAQEALVNEILNSNKVDVDVYKYAIIDKTSTSHEYILGEQDELCQFWCNAKLYQTIEEAERQIEHANWDAWAEVVEVTTEMLYI